MEIMINDGYLIPINGKIHDSSKLTGINASEENQQILEKLEGKSFDLSEFGIEVVNGGCYCKGGLYKTIEIGNVNESINCYRFFDTIFKILGRSYLAKKIKDLCPESYEYFGWNCLDFYFEKIKNGEIMTWDPESKLLNNLTEDEMNFLINLDVENVDLNVQIENELLKENIISCGSGDRFCYDFRKIIPLKENEIINGECNDPYYYINDTYCFALGSLVSTNKPIISFPDEDDFKIHYRIHFNKIMSKIIPELGKRYLNQ